MPPLLNNHGNFIVSLGNVPLACRKGRGGRRRDHPGFAATEVLFGARRGRRPATGDMGVGRNNLPKSRLLAAWNCGRIYLARRRRTRHLTRPDARFGLDRDRDAKVGIGLKELWEVAPEPTGPAWSTPSAGRSTIAPG